MASQSTPSVTSGGNLPEQSNSGSSSVSSRDRSSHSDVSGMTCLARVCKVVSTR